MIATPPPTLANFDGEYFCGSSPSLDSLSTAPHAASTASTPTGLGRQEIHEEDISEDVESNQNNNQDDQSQRRLHGRDSFLTQSSSSSSLPSSLPTAARQLEWCSMRMIPMLPSGSFEASTEQTTAEVSPNGRRQIVTRFKEIATKVRRVFVRRQPQPQRRRLPSYSPQPLFPVCRCGGRIVSQDVGLVSPQWYQQEQGAAREQKLRMAAQTGKRVMKDQGTQWEEQFHTTNANAVALASGPPQFPVRIEHEGRDLLAPPSSPAARQGAPQVDQRTNTQRPHGCCNLRLEVSQNVPNLSFGPQLPPPPPSPMESRDESMQDMHAEGFPHLHSNIIQQISTQSFSSPSLDERSHEEEDANLNGEMKNECSRNAKMRTASISSVAKSLCDFIRSPLHRPSEASAQAFGEKGKNEGQDNENADGGVARCASGPPSDSHPSSPSIARRGKMVPIFFHKESPHNFFRSISDGIQGRRSIFPSARSSSESSIPPYPSLQTSKK